MEQLLDDGPFARDSRGRGRATVDRARGARGLVLVGAPSVLSSRGGSLSGARPGCRNRAKGEGVRMNQIQRPLNSDLTGEKETYVTRVRTPRAESERRS